MPPHEPPASGPEPSRPPKRASFLQVVGAVFWSFFGVRKKKAMSEDIGSINPLHVVIVGVALAAIFVLTLITLVHFIVRSA